MSLPYSPDQTRVVTLKSEYEIMMALSIERKGQNYTLLRGWDQMRAERLSIHRKTVDQITEYTETSLQLSINYISVIKQFLSDKYDQFVKYSKHSLVVPGIDKETQLIALVYKEPAEQLSQLCKDAKSYQENALSMAVVIETLLKKVQQELIIKESELITLKQEVNSLNEELLDVNDEAYECCVNLSDIFHKEKAGNVFKSKEDFYALEEGFMVIAQDQTEFQRELGLKVIQLFKWGEETKQKRHEFLKGVLIEYYTTHQEMHKVEGSSQQLIDQIRNQSYKNQLSVEDILDRQSRKDVARMLGDENNKLVMANLEQFIVNLEFARFDPRNLVLKETRAKYKSGNGELFDKHLVLTVDAYLHFMVDRNYDYETTWTIKLDKGVKIKAVSETELDITKNYGSGGLLKNLLPLKKDSNNLLSISLVFVSGDSMVEFCEFVEKVLV